MRVCIWMIAIAVLLALAALALMHHGRNAVIAYERDHGHSLDGKTCRCDGFAWRSVGFPETAYCEFSFTVASDPGHHAFASTTSYTWSPFSGVVWHGTSISAH